MHAAEHNHAIKRENTLAWKFNRIHTHAHVKNRSFKQTCIYALSTSAQWTSIYNRINTSRKHVNKAKSFHNLNVVASSPQNHRYTAALYILSQLFFVYISAIIPAMVLAELDPYRKHWHDEKKKKQRETETATPHYHTHTHLHIYAPRGWKLRRCCHCCSQLLAHITLSIRVPAV